MNLPTQIANQLREAHTGDGWIGSSLKIAVADLTWRQATTQVHSLNTIAALVYHLNYYVSGVSQVLQGGALTIRDKYSYDCPPITSQQEWERLLEKAFADAEEFASLVEQLPEEKLWEDFSENKYGNYYKNLQGIIEHLYYHIGQIVLIRKLVLQPDENPKSGNK